MITRHFRRLIIRAAVLGWLVFGGSLHATAEHTPGAQSAPDIPISRRDRVYAAEQFSNTVSVIDPPITRSSE